MNLVGFWAKAQWHRGPSRHANWGQEAQAVSSADLLANSAPQSCRADRHDAPRRHRRLIRLRLYLSARMGGGQLHGLLLSRDPRRYHSSSSAPGRYPCIFRCRAIIRLIRRHAVHRKSRQIRQLTWKLALNDRQAAAILAAADLAVNVRNTYSTPHAERSSNYWHESRAAFAIGQRTVEKCQRVRLARTSIERHCCPTRPDVIDDRALTILEMTEAPVRLARRRGPSGVPNPLSDKRGHQ